MKLPVVAAFLIVAGCGSPPHRVTTGANPTVPSVETTTNPSVGTDSLKTTAADYAQAYLASDLNAMTRIQDPSCLGSVESDPAAPPDAEQDWSSLKTVWNAKLRDDLGVSPDFVKVTGVRVRDLTATTAAVEVEYDQPISVTGDQNWVRYALRDGQWKNDCMAPIGNGSKNPAMPSDHPGSGTVFCLADVCSGGASTGPADAP